MTTRAETITILFTDLVSSTELLQRAGDEQAQQIFKAHHALLRGAVTAHGGHEVKWLGDGLMVAFDSAADAARCAIAMQQDSRRPAAGERLEIRVGLNVGETMRDESDYFGTPVVVARRLCDKAGAGQIYASDLVVRLLDGRREFQFDDLGALALKGITEPVRAHQILYEHDPVAMLARTPFIGRAEELAGLHRTFEAARAGRGGMAVLVGEPGIGKTRTAEEFCEHARGLGALVLWGRCYEGDWAPPFSPFAEAMRQYAQTADDDALRGALGNDAGILARVVPALRERLPNLPESPALPVEGERYRLLEAVSSFFRSAAGGRTLLLVLDDLHWADSGTIAMLLHLAREAKTQSTVLLGTYRDVELGRQHPLAGALADLRRETTFERIVLMGLEHADVERLLDVIAEQDVPEELVRAIGKETAGNPFFIREVLLHLLEEGKVVSNDGKWQATVSIADMGIPEGVRGVIGRRLSRLSEPANRLLSAASAFDGGFSFDIVRPVSGLDENVALDAIDEALKAQVLRSAAGADTYDFTHALIRHTLYEEMSPSRQVRLHRQIGEAIESRFADDLEPRLGELAYHFYRAADAGDVDKAIDYCRRAGDQARAHFAHEDAVTHYQHALEMYDSPSKVDQSRRLALLLALGRAQGPTGVAAHADSIQTFLNAADVARNTNDADAFALAAHGYWDGLVWAGATPADYPTSAVALLQEAVQRFGERTDAPAVKALANLGWALFGAGHDDEGLRVCEQAISLARALNDPATLAWTIDESSFVRWRPDLLEQRLALAEECVRLCTSVSDREREMWAHYVFGQPLLEAGDVEAAEREFDASSRIAHELRIPVALWYEKIWAASQAFLSGNLEHGEALSVEAFAFGQHYIGQALVWHTIQIAYVRMEQGRIAEVLPVLRLAAEQNGDESQARVWRAYLAFALLETGDDIGACEQVEMLMSDGGPHLRFDNTWVFGMTFLSEAASRLRDGRCDALYRLFSPYPAYNATIANGALCTGSSSRPLGLLAGAIQQWDEAERHFADALEMNTRMGARPWVARTQMNYAETLLQRDGPGDREKADSLLQQALVAAREMGMTKVAADCEALLGGFA